MSPDRKRSLFRLELGHKRVERDVDEEMAFHLEMRTKKLVERGLDPRTAREQAMQLFGDLPAVRAECLTIDHDRHRAINRMNRLQNLQQDMLYALRTLRKNKGFAAITLCILALGIGANTAMFSLIDVLMLRALSVPNAKELITIGNPARTNSLSEGSPRGDIASFPVYSDVRAQARTVTGIYATGRTSGVNVVVREANAESQRVSHDPEHPRARLVSGNYFGVLQVAPFRGRTFAETEDKAAGDAPVVVISYAYWQHRFAGSTNAIGRELAINGVPFTIVGVAARGFTGDLVGQPIEIWIPIMMQPLIMPNTRYLVDRNINWLQMMARRAPGATLEQVQAELKGLVRRSILEHTPASGVASLEADLRTRPIRVEPGAQGFSAYRSVYAKSLLTLMGAVGLVLLVACANVANLLLARAAARGREMSVRMALGAGRVRLLQQLLTESAVIALGGGVLGLGVATWGSRALLRMANDGRGGIALDTSIDMRILAFSAGVSLLTALLFGLAPAFRATRVQLATALRTSGRSVSGGGNKLNVGRLLVMAQIAMSLLLLIGTGMLVRSTQKLLDADVGAARDKLIIVNLDAERAGYSGARLSTFMREVAKRSLATPGVVAASASENGIFSGTESGGSLFVEGFVARADEDTSMAYDDVGAGYFGAVGARMLQGRDFGEQDTENGARVAVMNKAAADHFFPKGDAVGHHVKMGDDAYEIVGVVADIKESGLREQPERRFYFSIYQMDPLPSRFYLQVRTSRDPLTVIAALRSAIQGADPALPIRSILPLSLLIRDSISSDRLVARVVTFFGVLTLVLAALGLYGVMAYATVRRTSEFGLRIALGAVPSSIVRMVLRDALKLTMLGVIVGLPLAWYMVKLLRNLFFGIGLFDIPTVVATIAVLAGSATVAGLVPALRASRVTPLDALRSE